jgi:hypothetical protein
MKDLGKTKFCLGLQLEHLPTGTLVHQSAYIQKILQKFKMYIANCTKPDIAFAVNLLARYSAALIQRHWAGVKIPSDISLVQ